MEFCNWYKATNKPDMSDKELMLLRAQTMVSMSTRILGRRTAPFPPFLIPNRAPYGVTPRS